jgi:peptidoglycan hydrolase-like protein with peptidoglycan-binding domain
MMITYAYGYAGSRLSLQEMEARPMWNRIHPEMRRRLVAMFDDARANGRDLGIGGGYRSSAQQRSLFLSRYVEDPNGTVRYDGKLWSKKPGVAAAAPPGRSYHEETDPNGFCFAADLIGDLNWMNANCHRFGLKHFANVNNEPWHVQPVELPNSRSGYNPSVTLKSDLPVAEKPPVGAVLRFDYPGTPIKRGSRGDAVKLVQLVVGAGADGWFWLATESKVKAWQRANGLLDDGVVGPITWKKMFG